MKLNLGSDLTNALCTRKAEFWTDRWSRTSYSLDAEPGKPYWGSWEGNRVPPATQEEEIDVNSTIFIFNVTVTICIFIRLTQTFMFDVRDLTMD